MAGRPRRVAVAEGLGIAGPALPTRSFFGEEVTTVRMSDEDDGSPGTPALAWQVDRHPDAGVTLVELVIESDRRRRVRVESLLAGPVWPPRRDGRPLEGWDDRGVTLTVDPGRTPLGFASPAPPTSPPATLVAPDGPRALPAADPGDRDVPPGVRSWLERVERRVEHAEALAEAETLEEATAAVAAVGGIGGVHDVADTLHADRRTLSRLSFVPDSLAERAEDVVVPTETLARLA